MKVEKHNRIRWLSWVLALGLSLQTGWAIQPPVTWEVKQDRLWGKRSGVLTLEATRIVFQPKDDQETPLRWHWHEIQELRIDGPQKLQIRSYRDVWWRGNRDRWLSFELQQGELTEEIADFLRTRLQSPLVSTIFAVPRDALERVPAKHRHALGGGCDGELLLTSEALYFLATGNTQRHQRKWLVTEIEDLGRRSARDLRVTVSESSWKAGRRNYHFQLKRPLDDAGFEYLWRRIFVPPSWADQLGSDTASDSIGPPAPPAPAISQPPPRK